MTPEDVIREADREIERADKLLTVAKAAHRLQVCRATVRRWIKSGYLPAMRYPGGFKIRPNDIEKIQSTPVHTDTHPTV
jgi:excisionase family DNA binding protein